MRDWNNSSIYRVPSNMTGFYPTYEGLKLYFPSSKFPPKVSFYPTYEGLKLRKFKKLILGITSFYPTYEGLKLWIPPWALFSLCLFLSYLWGIETPVLLEKMVVKIRVFILPMRDWNVLWTQLSLLWKFVFILPMRDWNILNILFSNHTKICFYPTYEGLKLDPNSDIVFDF